MTPLERVPMPPAIAALPRDERGYPIPAFVATLADGTRDLRVASGAYKVRVAREKICWICARPLTPRVAFITGPLGMQNRHAGDGPMHVTCAKYAIQVCPHLNSEHSQIREANRPPGERTGVNAIDDKPPVIGMAVTTKWGSEIYRAKGDIVFNWRSPKVYWFHNGREISPRARLSLIEPYIKRLKEKAASDD
jgi:hypothetical protein